MKFFLFSLGCKVNSYENESLKGVFLARGYIETFDHKEADIILINTCAVTATSEQKSRQHISKFRRESPNAVLIVMGCYSKENINQASSLGADIVIGTSNRNRIPDLLDQFLIDKKPIAIPDPLRREGEYEESLSFALPNTSRAYLKIQDGCDNFCSYCLIPFLRGKSRSRNKENVLKEAKMLEEKGYKEIVITGIEIGFYGKDLGDGSYHLGDLVRDICLSCPKVLRVRLSSLNASEVDESLLSALRDCPSIADHLHLSLQSGSTSVLERMKRPYTPEEYFDKLNKIREIRPSIAISTDIIAGFPLESEQEWRETLDFAKKCRFMKIHVFPFSSRKGTVAANMKDTDPRIKKERVRELLALSEKMATEYSDSFLGQKMDVLFEEYSEENALAYGHSSNYLMFKKRSDHSLHGRVEKLEYTIENRVIEK